MSQMLIGQRQIGLLSHWLGAQAACVEAACSPCVCLVSLLLLCFPLQCKDTHIKADWYWAHTFPQASVRLVLCLDVAPSSPQDSWDQLQHLCDTECGTGWWTNRFNQRCFVPWRKLLGKRVGLRQWGWNSREDAWCLVLLDVGQKAAVKFCNIFARQFNYTASIWQLSCCTCLDRWIFKSVSKSFRILQIL